MNAARVPGTAGSNRDLKFMDGYKNLLSAVLTVIAVFVYALGGTVGGTVVSAHGDGGDSKRVYRRAVRAASAGAYCPLRDCDRRHSDNRLKW